MAADDDAVGYEQARRLLATLTAARIDRGHLWLYDFGLGGDVSEFEVDAYLYHSLLLPRLQRDVLAQAANEILADTAPPRAPCAADLTGRLASPAGPDGAGGEADDEAGEQTAAEAGDRSSRETNSGGPDRNEPEAPGE